MYNLKIAITCNIQTKGNIFFRVEDLTHMYDPLISTPLSTPSSG